MRVLMLGWEFPPFISGGLGTACYGLTKALSRQNAQVTFVLPKNVGSEYVSHVKLLSPQAPKAAAGDRRPESVASTYQMTPTPTASKESVRNIVFKAVPSRLPSPYAGTDMEIAAQGETNPDGIGFLSEHPHESQAAPEPTPSAGQDAANSPLQQHHPGPPVQEHYNGDLFQEAQRYAQLCVDLAKGEQFDVIHAHDWLTYPAAMAVAAATGKPLVVHVHSTEFDRAGENINQRIYDVERRGVHAAVRIIAVSHMTRTILERRYGVDPHRVDVVYNGIENGQPIPPEAVPLKPAIKKTDKIVLFLGRVTMQKGPEYFVAAAKRVLERYDKVKFLMAGSGDKIKEIIQLAAEAGIGHKILFTGFLRGSEVDRIFKMADVYVMPSVSEPFGIAALEAISHDVPVIISKNSGVSEVLQHALKVDFWDIDEMANKIIAVLKHPPLASTLKEHADIEARRLTWDDAARKCRHVYDVAVAAMPR